MSSHGVKGLVKIKSQLTSIEAFLELSTYCREDGSPLSLTPKFLSKGSLVAEIEGISDKTQADAHKNLPIYTQESFTSSPEENEFLYSDLIDATVNVNSQSIGQVVEVYNHGAGDILSIKRLPQEGSKAKTVDIPFLETYFPSIDLTEKTLILTKDALELFSKLTETSAS